MVNVRPKDLRVVRSRVERPILRRKLLTLLDEYNELYDTTASRVGLPRKLANRVAVLSDSCVAKVFSSDTSSLSAFRRASGVLISTSLSIQFQDRRNILCDTDFWSLWDIIVMRSGWVLIDVQQFNSAFNGGGCRYLGLVRFLPSLLCGQRCCASSGLCRVPLCTMSISRLCSSDGAYSACGDIWTMLMKQSSKIGISGRGRVGHSSAEKFERSQVLSFEYQLKLLRSMIDCRLPICDVILFCMEINAMIVGFSSPLSPDFDAENQSHLGDLLARELMVYIHFTNYADDVIQLVAFIDADFI